MSADIPEAIGALPPARAVPAIMPRGRNNRS